MVVNNDQNKQNIDLAESTKAIEGNKIVDKSIVHGEARFGMKDLMAEVQSNPFAISQEQGEKFADSGEIMSDAHKGGEGIDSSNNLAQINEQIDRINAKIKAIEEKGEQVTTQDKREKYALNKELIILKDKAIKAKQDTREAAIKAEDKTTEAAIKEKQAIVEKNNQIIKKGLEDLESRFK